jgi:hypothetical protein
VSIEEVDMPLWMEIRGPVYVAICGAIVVRLVLRLVAAARRLTTDPASFRPAGLSPRQTQMLHGLLMLFGMALIFLWAFLFRTGFGLQQVWLGEGRSGPHLSSVLLYTLVFVSMMVTDHRTPLQQQAARTAFGASLVGRAVILSLVFAVAFFSLADW